MAVAIRDSAASYELIQKAQEYVLAVPGVSLATEALFCGVNSMRDADKVQRLGLTLSRSQEVSVPGLRKAIANIELVKETCVEVGDHLLAIGRVLRFGVRANCRELPLLSIGPDTRGYRVLAQRGVHRIAVVDTDGAQLEAVSKQVRNSQ
jgi:flavin reductase (DIM6/NTAB) family NADH-FMN oxidoreductase RutF